MARQDVSAGAAAPGMPMRPDTILQSYGPGAMARLSPAERAKKLKRAKKGAMPAPALVAPPSVLGR